MKISLLLTAFLIALACYSPAVAAGPQSITYQGYVKDGSGAPVNSQVTLTFRLYDSPSGGSPIWLESQLVTPQNGIYSVELGTESPLNASIFGTAHLYLGIQIGSDQELVPRQHITSTPFAIRADMADMAENVNSANVILDAGQITSGTIDPARLPANLVKLDTSQTVTGDKIFSDQTLLLRNGSNTFSTTLQAPSATVARTISLPDATGTAITTGNLSAVTSVGTISSGTWNGTAISPAYGGTGTNTSSTATGSLLTSIGTGTWGTLPPGTNGQVLKMTGGVPAWGTDSTGSTNGTVTSVAVSGGTTGLTTTGGPITDSGTINLGGVLGIANGGTGATSTTTALNILLPPQSGNANKVLGTNGSTASWIAAPGFGTGTNWAAEGIGRECTLGEIILTAGGVANGMPANGQILNISQNTALFALLGTRYGGNGSTTFALPDLRSIAPNNLTYSICTSGIFPSRL